MTNKDQDKSIYICIGNTGTGKSTFVKSLGGDVPSSELVRSGDSLTTKAKFYRLHRHPTVLLVDTPGFRDSQASYGELGFSDSEHMKDIINAFVRAKATHFNGIYWFVNESRKNDELRAQARFIDNLVNPEIDTPVADRSLGWKHVMVLIHGNAAVGAAVESVVKAEIGDTALAKSLQHKRVGLLLDGEDPGRCDLKIEGRTLQDSRHYEIFELQESLRSMIFNDWFRDRDSIQVCISTI
jgi:energy-coupling factor transporter ATP-binding protein EcfA2